MVDLGDALWWVGGHDGPSRRHSACGFVIVACGVFEQRLIEVIGGALGAAKVVGGDGEDIFAELQFERGAGGGDVTIWREALKISAVAFSERQEAFGAMLSSLGEK